MSAEPFAFEILYQMGNVKFHAAWFGCFLQQLLLLAVTIIKKIKYFNSQQDVTHIIVISSAAKLDAPRDA